MIKIAALVVVLAPALARADKALDKNGTWNCKKDPVASLSNGKMKVSFKGHCTKIDVGTGENTLTIEAVDTLVVGGGENNIMIGTVGTIDVGGAKNAITWKKAASGDKPVLKGQPEQNTIKQAK